MSGVDYMLNMCACVRRSLNGPKTFLWHAHFISFHFVSFHFLLFRFVGRCQRHRKLYFIYKIQCDEGCLRRHTRLPHITGYSVQRRVELCDPFNAITMRQNQWWRQQSCAGFNWMAFSVFCRKTVYYIMDKGCLSVAPVPVPAPVCYWNAWSGPTKYWWCSLFALQKPGSRYFKAVSRRHRLFFLRSSIVARIVLRALRTFADVCACLRMRKSRSVFILFIFSFQF